MAKIKICGLRRKEDIDYVNRYMPDYVGFVFAGSKRQVTKEEAAELKGRLKSGIKAAGVFVNEKPEVIADICRRGIIDLIQLHGDEDLRYIEKLKAMTDKPLIRAVRVRTPEQVLEAQKLPCEYLLLDTYTKESYGGSGRTMDRSLIPRLKKPWFLAGGLSAEVLPEAMEEVSPFGFDVSSGAETDGFKDEEKIRKIIEIIRRAK